MSLSDFDANQNAVLISSIRSRTTAGCWTTPLPEPTAPSFVTPTG